MPNFIRKKLMALQVLKDAEFHRKHYTEVVAKRVAEAQALGASFREIAQILGISVGAAHARYRNKDEDEGKDE